MKGPEETYQVVNIPLSFAGFQEPLAFRSRGFLSLGEVLVELGESAYSMLEDGIINIRTIHFFAVDGELIPGILDMQNDQACLSSELLFDGLVSRLW